MAERARSVLAVDDWRIGTTLLLWDFLVGVFALVTPHNKVRVTLLMCTKIHSTRKSNIQITQSIIEVRITSCVFRRETHASLPFCLHEAVREIQQ